MPIGASSFSLRNQFVQTVIDQHLIPAADVTPGFDWGFDLNVPFELLGVFARNIDTAAPITSVPVFGLVRFAITKESRDALHAQQIDIAAKFPAVPLGVIGTDHVGYGSFDLSPLRQVEVLQSIKMSLHTAKLLDGGKPRLAVEISQILVMPFKDPGIAFGALTEGDIGPNFICLRMDLDASMLANRGDWPPMPAMQTPGILDWRLSPGSFSMSGALLVGEGGCETLLPSNLATELIRFQQIARGTQEIAAELSDRSERDIPGFGFGFAHKVRLGYVIQYNTE